MKGSGSSFEGLLPFFLWFVSVGVVCYNGGMNSLTPHTAKQFHDFVERNKDNLLKSVHDDDGCKRVLVVDTETLSLKISSSGMWSVVYLNEGGWHVRSYWGEVGNYDREVGSVVRVSDEEMAEWYAYLTIVNVHNDNRRRAVLDDLYRFIPGFSLEYYGGSCPVQAEGSLNGLRFYFRYRGGFASLKVGVDAIGEPMYSASKEYGDELQGWATDGEFLDLFKELYLNLERSPFLWQFNATFIRDIEGTLHKKGDVEKQYSWGHTAEEAFEHFVNSGDRYAEMDGPLHEYWQMFLASVSLKPEPVNRDLRQFPDPEPVFEFRAVKGSE